MKMMNFFQFVCALLPTCSNFPKEILFNFMTWRVGQPVISTKDSCSVPHIRKLYYLAGALLSSTGTCNHLLY